MSHSSSGALRTYIAVYAALLLLTGLTVTLALKAHLGAWEVPVALGIASVKTVLVGLFFMHMIHSSRLVWVVVFTGVVFLGFMVVLVMADYWTRSAIPGRTPAKQPHAVLTR